MDLQESKQAVVPVIFVVAAWDAVIYSEMITRLVSTNFKADNNSHKQRNIFAIIELQEQPKHTHTHDKEWLRTTSLGGHQPLISLVSAVLNEN